MLDARKRLCGADKDAEMDNKKRSGKEYEILAYIKRYMTATGFTPSYREIGAVMGLKSTSSVHSYMMRLVKEGLIEFKKDSDKFKPVGAEWKFDAETSNTDSTNNEEEP